MKRRFGLEVRSIGLLALVVLAQPAAVFGQRLERTIWLPAPEMALKAISGMTCRRTPDGVVIAAVTTDLLRRLTEYGVPYMVLSIDDVAFLTTGRMPTAGCSPALPKRLSHQKVAVIADEAAYQLCQSQLATYKQDVESQFDAELTTYHGTWPTAESLRQFIHALWSSDRITGVIQVGSLPYAMWEFPWGEVCPIPLFHEDMDGGFADRDGDGKYDWHTWGANDGPELWCAYMRPANGRLSDLPGFLDKCHSYYQGSTSVPRRANVFVCRDWGGCAQVMHDALVPIYGDSIQTTGGPGIALSGEQYLNTLAQGHELTNVWVHSAPYFHQFDTAPHRDVQDYEVRNQTPGSLFTVIWGCHGVDWNESPSHCFAEAYVFNPGNGLADMGVTRSIGTERTEWFFGYLNSCDLANAYFSYIDRLYDPDWIHSQWPSDTTECFMFDFALFGNPFWSPRPSGAPLTWQQETNINQGNGQTQYEGGNPNGNGLFDGNYINTNYPPYGGYLRELAPGTGYGRYYRIDLTGFSGADSVRPYWVIRGSHAGGAYQYVDVNGRARWDDPNPQDTTTWWVWSWTLGPSVFNWNSGDNYIKVGNQGRAWATLCLRAIGCYIYGAQPMTEVEEPNVVSGAAVEQNARLFAPSMVSGPVKIRYALPKTEAMQLAVIDASGRIVRVLAKGSSRVGDHSSIWDLADESGQAVRSGVYFCRLDAGEFTATRKIVKLE